MTRNVNPRGFISLSSKKCHYHAANIPFLLKYLHFLTKNSKFEQKSTVNTPVRLQAVKTHITKSLIFTLGRPILDLRFKSLYHVTNWNKSHIHALRCRHLRRHSRWACGSGSCGS